MVNAHEQRNFFSKSSHMDPTTLLKFDKKMHLTCPDVKCNQPEINTF